MKLNNPLPNLPLAIIKIGQRDSVDATGNVAYAGIGFRPSKIIAFAACDDLLLDGAKSVGMCGNNGIAYCIHDSTDGTLHAYEDKLIRLVIGPAGTNYQQCTVKSFDIDGFTLAWVKNNTPTGTIDLVFLCIE